MRESGDRIERDGGKVSEPNCVLVLFESPHQALRAESTLKKAEIPHWVVNTPREFSLHCGISIRIPLRLGKEAEELLRRERVGFQDIVPYFSRWVE